MARFLKDIWAAVQGQRERWIFWSPVPVAFGICFYFGLHREPPAALGLIAAALLAPLLAAFYRHRPAFFALLALFLAAGGFTAAQLRTMHMAAPVLEKRTYAVTLRGRIVAVDPLPKSYRIVLDDIAVVEGKIWQETLPRRVRIRMKNNDPAVPQAGDVVEIKGALLPLSPPLLPGAFDFQRHAFFQGLGATGYAYGDLKVVEPRATGHFFFEKLRRRIREKIAAAVPDRDNAALLTAFMIGEDNGISEQDWETARRSGIAHLIAISGSHFVLIAGFPFFLVRFLLAAIPYVALRWPVKKIAAVAAMAVSVFYMLLIGSPVPAQRAVIMTCVVMTAIMLDRNPFTLRLAVFAAFILFLFRPESVTGPSFQMSFAAVVGLIAFYESTREWWKRHFREAGWAKRYSLYLLGCFMTTLVASTATTPYALYHFSRMQLLGGLLANMVAVPVSSFITFPVGLFACLLMPLGLETWPLVVAEKSLDVFMYVAELVAAWPYAGMDARSFPAWVLAVVTLGGLWICIWQGRMRWLGFLPVAAGTVLAFTAPRADVLIADSGRLFAVRGPAGQLWFSTLRREKFVREQWQIREGVPDGKYLSWPDAAALNAKDAGDAGESFLACDGALCFYRKNGATVAFVEDPASMSAACREKPQMIVSGEPLKRARNCAKDMPVIDKWTLRDDGAHAVYIREDGTLDIRTVRETRGIRPWTGPPPKAPEKKTAMQKSMGKYYELK